MCCLPSDISLLASATGGLRATRGNRTWCQEWDLAKMEKYLAPEPIGEGDLNEQWKRFKREFEQFLVAVGKDKETEPTKLAIFLRIVGQRVNDLYETMQFAEGEDRSKWSVVSGKLDGLCAPRTSKHVLRDKFFQLKQDGKSVDQFVLELRKQSRDCQFGALRDDLMLHVLIRGVDSERMRRRMFETDKLDLEKAVQMCQVMESTTVDLQQMGTRLEPQPGLTKPVEAQEGVAAVNSRRPSGSIGEKRSKDRPGAKPFSGSPHPCSRCGWSHKPRQCPAYGQKCLNCHGLNHFARMCNKAKQQSAHLVGDWADPESPTDESGEVLLITVERVGKKLLARVQFHIEGRVKMVTCQLDTAASCNVMSRADYNKLGCPKLTTSNVVLTMYDGTVKKSLGRCCVQVSNRVGEVTTLRFELLETSHHSLLSLQTCLDLKLLSYEVESVCLVEAHNKLTKDQIVADYPDVFRGLGLFPGEYTIELDTAIPPVQNRPRRIPHTMKQAVESKLAEMEKAGIIAQVDTPTDWISNMTAVWKADKKQVRICLDPRDLNKAVKRNHFGMPTLDDVLPRLVGAKVFSILDAKDGFLHVKLSEESSFLTTFWGPQCRYRWCRLPFGLCSAPEEFQRRLQSVLYGIDGVAVVADDILIFGKGDNMKEAQCQHDEALLRVLQRAREYNIKLNKDKMQLHLPELVYIGHRVSAAGIKPDPAKVAAIKQMPVLKSVPDVRRFLGMCNYLARFIPKLSQVSEPLRKLLEADQVFQWGNAEQKAFEDLKTLICEDQLLNFFDVIKPVVIQCDASTEGLGATLMQGGRPVLSASRSLTKSEKNYVAIELECLAIVFACRKFDQFIYGKQVVVETDHKPLEVIAKKTLLAAPRRLQRMLLQLQRYDLDITYHPGNEQVMADVLSRFPVGQPSTEELTSQEVFGVQLDNMVTQEIEVIRPPDFISVRSERFGEVRKAAEADAEQCALRRYISEGWPPNVRQVPTLVRPYWNFRELLVMQDGIIYKGDQIVVPLSLRADYLSRLHGL